MTSASFRPVVLELDDFPQFGSSFGHGLEDLCLSSSSGPFDHADQMKIEYDERQPSAEDVGNLRDSISATWTHDDSSSGASPRELSDPISSKTYQQLHSSQPMLIRITPNVVKVIAGTPKKQRRKSEVGRDCPQCGKHILTQFTRHMRTHSPDANTYKCNVAGCNKSYTRRYDLDDHLREHVSGQL